MTRTRKNPDLEARIANLQLRLAPLVPLPEGEPHSAFPRTLLAYHLLTEEELDSIAHHYHQSTPSIWTNHYPATMNWDKEWLNAYRERRRSSVISTSHPQTEDQGQLREEPNSWLQQFVNEVSESVAATPAAGRRRSSSAKPSKGMTDTERIAIKRRKVGKFIGLIDMETPESEIEGKLRDAMEAIIQAGQDELRQTEEWYMRRRKIG